MNISNEVVAKALIFAAKKHKKQNRKGNNLPYIIHPIRVASLLLEVKETKNINLFLTAIFLHDVVEDCGVSLKKIAKKFGLAVATLVEELTLDKEKYETIGKTKYLCQEVLKMSNYALCIKLCDRLDNIKDTKHMSREFVIKYIKETKEILKAVKTRKLTGTHLALIKVLEDKLKELKKRLK